MQYKVVQLKVKDYILFTITILTLPASRINFNHNFLLGKVVLFSKFLSDPCKLN